MSKTIKTFFILIVLIAVVWAIWAYMSKTNTGMNQPVENNTYVASTTDTSDAAINQDMSNLDSQLDSLNSDAASLDATASNQ